MKKALCMLLSCIFFIISSLQANLIHQPSLSHLDRLVEYVILRPESFWRHAPADPSLKKIYATKVLCRRIDGFSLLRQLGNKPSSIMYYDIESCLGVGVRFDSLTNELPLHRAVACGDERVFSIILHAMTKPSIEPNCLNIIDRSGMTAAHLAAKTGNVYAFVELSKAGALMHEPDYTRQTAIGYAEDALTRYRFPIDQRQKLLTLIWQIKKKKSDDRLLCRMQQLQIEQAPSSHAIQEQPIGKLAHRRRFTRINPILTNLLTQRAWEPRIAAPAAPQRQQSTATSAYSYRAPIRQRR